MECLEEEEVRRQQSFLFFGYQVSKPCNMKKQPSDEKEKKKAKSKVL